MCFATLSRVPRVHPVIKGKSGQRWWPTAFLFYLTDFLKSNPMFRIGSLLKAGTSSANPDTGAAPAVQRAGTASPEGQRPQDERPLNRNPQANAGLASRLRNSMADHLMVRGTDGSMIKPINSASACWMN